MVFVPEAAPKTAKEFNAWYDSVTDWEDDKPYNDPAVCVAALQNWYTEMTVFFPDLNGEDTDVDRNRPTLTDYSIAENFIYLNAGMRQAGPVSDKSMELASKYKLGFFDCQSEDEIFIPDETDKMVKMANDRPAKHAPWWKIW